VLSRCCDGCQSHKSCKIRYVTVSVGGFVFCADGSRNLVDCEDC
jgi:hypothetical protein